MNVLVIAAHGSRKKESNLEVAELTEKLSAKLAGRFERVEFAFLQFALPLLETRLKELVEEGARKLVIFPFFIGSGSHIKEDIPGLVTKAKKKYPNAEFKITRHLGKIEAVEDVIVNEVST